LRKIYFIAAFMLCFLVNCTASAAQNQNIGFVIIGGVEFKTSDYYKIVQNVIKPLSGAQIVVGNDLQTRYKKYWLKRGFIGEQPPQQSDLINFTNMSGCKKVVYIIISDAVIDKHNSSNHREKSRISVQLDAYLCTSTEVVDMFAASDEESSKGSDLRARRGAFKKCLNEISKTLNNLL